MDPETWERVYREDTSKMYKVSFFAPGGTISSESRPTNIHFLSVEAGQPAPSRHRQDGARPIEPHHLRRAHLGRRRGLRRAVSALLGSVIGAASGFYGGVFDIVTQRVSELLLSFPTLPSLWR
jgi:peptide/nickel transport system permease protein